MNDISMKVILEYKLNNLRTFTKIQITDIFKKNNKHNKPPNPQKTQQTTPKEIKQWKRIDIKPAPAKPAPSKHTFYEQLNNGQQYQQQNKKQISEYIQQQQDSVNKMNRVLLSQLEQLKCNFCTQWFSVPADFATLQKYSLNACQQCLNNFKYRLVDPSTYQLYDVVLIRTGIELTNKHHQLQNKFQAYLKSHVDSNSLTKCQAQVMIEQDIKNTDMKAQLNMNIQPIKQRVSQFCRQLFYGLIKNWNQIISDLSYRSNKFDEEKQNIIKVLSDRWYDFKTDKAGVLDLSRVENVAEKLKTILEESKNVRAEDMIGKIKSFVGEFFGINMADNEKEREVEDKENRTPNSKRNLRNIRQKLMRSSRNFDNQLKINNSNNNSVLKSNIKSSRKNFNKSSKKNLLIQPINLKKQSLQKPQPTALKTPRSYRSYRPQQPLQLPQPSILDQLRDKMSKIIKQPVQLITYMPEQPTKPQNMLNKRFGQKCLVEYLVELKLKTSINDNICELINENLSKGNIMCYLKSLDAEWKHNISLIRFVKVHLHDFQFDSFLNWFQCKNYVSVLVLTNNFLTELSVQALYAFAARHPHLGLRQAYFGNNYIKPSKARRAIEGLRSLGIQVHI